MKSAEISGSATMLHDRFLAMRAASRRSVASTLAERRKLLEDLHQLLSGAQDRIVAAIAQDFGARARAETELLEIVPVRNAIRHALRLLPRWMKDERRAVSPVFQPARAWVRHEPLGVVGIIAPWNYPLLLAVGPLVDVLAAGNRAMIKLSELTPAFGELLERLIAENFDPEQVSVTNGDIDVARAFSSLPFDHLVFTGSTATGRDVMLAAAANLTPVTLELGGKSPAVVAAGYPLAKAARSIAFGKFVNAGQTCIAPDYVLAPEAEAASLADLILQTSAKSYPSLGDDNQYSSIISDRHWNRLTLAVAEARAGGATILTRSSGDGDHRKFPPTIVLDPPAGCVLMTEEIFGPVLPLISYRTIDDAIAFIKGRDRPLALYCFTNDRGTRDKILSGATSGGVTVNGTLMHLAQDALPFGGIGPSGTGAYHGHEGFRRFSHARAVHQIGFLNAFELLGPPWGGLARTASRILARPKGEPRSA